MFATVSQDWDGVLAAAKGPALARVLAPSFGAANALAATVPALEDAWEDVAQASSFFCYILQKRKYMKECKGVDF